MMGSKRPEKSISTVDEFFYQWTPETLKNFQLPTGEYLKTNQKKNSKHFDFWEDSDSESKTELENAVKQYRKNVVKNKPAQEEANLCNKKNNHDVKESHNINKSDNTNFSRKKKNKEGINGEVNINGNPSAHLQDLINYFFLDTKDNRKKSSTKSYADYEKQGAIPKNKFKWEKSNARSKNAQIESRKVFPNDDQSRINEGFIEYKKDTNCFKVNEKFCSKPFYYIVPENPRSDFFLSPGSYYVIPKTPTSKSENRVLFHPENRTEHDLSRREVESETGILINENISISQIPINNLGKKVLPKMDSHLNIGPMDAKWNESNNNLENNFDSNKIFHKSFLNSDSSEASKRFEEGVRISKKNNDNPDCLDGIEVTNFLIESLNEGLTLESEVLRLQELDKTLQKLLSELPYLDANSAKVIADKYVMNEEGLENYISSARIKQKIQQQLERMVLALPENSYDELVDKCNEFQGEEELVTDFIMKAQQANKISQQIMDLQFVLPDADPDYLRQEIEKLNGNDDAFNTLTDQLLDNKDYPKISEDPLSAERRRWWQMRIENFNVKNYLLKVPNPGHFASLYRNINKEDEDLKIKFLQSRYPSRTRESLMDALHLNDFNITRTCESLKGVQLIRLSQSSFRSEVFSEDFLEEICYIDHKQEIDKYLEEEKERKEIEAEEARLNNSFLHCPLCSEDELIASEAICCLEGHVFCKDCIKRYIFVKISDGVYKFACPSECCDTVFSCTTLQEILPENILSNIIHKQQVEEISTAEVEGLESCPYCEFAYIPNPQDKIFKCQNFACMIETCRKCHEKNHIPLRCEEVERSVDVEARKKIEESMTQQLVRSCPKCQKKFVKINGCNKMVCVCGTKLCYICRKEVSGYDHFSTYNGDGKCPLHTNNEDLHTREVYEAGIRTREEILQENRGIRILHDPTYYHEF